MEGEDARTASWSAVWRRRTPPREAARPGGRSRPDPAATGALRPDREEGARERERERESTWKARARLAVAGVAVPGVEPGIRHIVLRALSGVNAAIIAGREGVGA